MSNFFQDINTQKNILDFNASINVAIEETIKL